MSDYSTKNYQKQGGEEWHIGGKLIVDPGGKLLVDFDAIVDSNNITLSQALGPGNGNLTQDYGTF